MYELSHDTLVAPILKAKAQRDLSDRAQEAQQLLKEVREKRKKKIIRAAVLLAIPLTLLFVVIILFIVGIKEVATAGSWQETLLIYTLFLAVALVVGFFILIGVAALVAFLHEFIAGESILSKLRKRAGNPAKQKGILTKIGRWLS